MVGTDITVVPDEDSRPSTQDVTQTVTALAPPMVPMTQQAPAPLPSNFLPIPTSLSPGRTSLPPAPSNPLDVETPKDVGEVDSQIAARKQDTALSSYDANNFGRQQQIRLPQSANYPMTPESTARHALSAFSNPLMWLAIAGGGLTRNHALGAMTAATGVLEGARANDMELQKLHAQKFKGSVAAAKRDTELALADYGTILDDKSMSDADKITTLNAMAAGHQDENIQRILTTGDPAYALKRVHEMVDGRRRMIQGLDDAQEKSTKLTPAQELKKRELDLRERGINVKEQAQGQTTPTGQPVLPPGFTQDDLDAAAHRWLRTGEFGSFSSRSGKNIPIRAAIEHRGNELAREEGINPADLPKRWQLFRSQQVGIQRFLSGPQSNVVRSLSVVSDHLATLQKLGNALNNGNIQRFNQLSQQWAQEFGKPAPTSMALASQIVGTEVIKSLGVAGAGTEGERSDLAGKFSRVLSPAQLQDAIHTAQMLIAGQERGLRRQFKNATGLDDEAFDVMMSEQGREFLKTPEQTKVEPPPVSMLKEGQVTTFKNGQKWRLNNGVPEQVQ